jgi:hypothetical protein
MSGKKRIRKLQPKNLPSITPSDEKLAELVVLVSRFSESDPLFGSIKLNKILFFIDFMAYRTLGKPVTGQAYFALENGPALRYKARLWNSMQKRRDIAVRKEPTVFDNDKERTLALRDPDVTKFSQSELGLIFKIIEAVRITTGSDLSDLSHTLFGWQLSKEKETIPYSMALVGQRKPTHAEIEYGLTLEASLA